MIEYKLIDLENLPRKAHLQYFMTMDRPHFNITAEVDVTDLLQFCKRRKVSFFLTFMHIVDLSAECIPQFRQRIHRLDGDNFEVREYVECPTSNTEPTGDELYCYSAIRHHMPYDEYIVTATRKQQEARERGTLEEDPDIEAFFFPTCVPWIHYTDVVHPLTNKFDSNPRFSWGKFEPDYRGRMMMPLTVVAHHALVDGIHVGKFYENVAKNMALLANAKSANLSDNSFTP